MRRGQARLRKETAERRSGVARRLLQAAFATALIALLGWGSHTLTRPSTFPVRHVQLSGELERIDMAQAREVILPFVTHGLVRVDVTALSEAVAMLPWVRGATVRRVWPDRVEVEIDEEEPLARWSNAGLVSEDGRLFTPPESEWPASLPVFEGPENTTHLMALRYRELREVLAPMGMKVALLAMNERRAFTLDLDNGMRLLLGRSDQQSRLERFVRAYGQVIEGRTEQVRQVDLRYTNGFTVVWKKQGPQA